MKQLLEHILKGSASEADALIRKALERKLAEALEAQRSIIGEQVYGVWEGLQAPEGQKSTRMTKENPAQKQNSLRQQNLKLGKKLRTLHRQAGEGTHNDTTAVDAQITRLKIRRNNLQKQALGTK